MRRRASAPFWSDARSALALVPYMHLQQPSGRRVGALGHRLQSRKEFAEQRIAAYTRTWVGYRWGYTFEDLSPAFRATPMAHFFADMFTERNPHADCSRSSTSSRRWPSPNADDSRIECPAIILSGSEDGTHQPPAA